MNDINIQNAIRLIKVQYPEFNFSINAVEYSNDSFSNELDMNLGHNIIFSENAQDSFIVEFTLKILNKKNNFIVNAKMIALFKTKELIDENFKHSSFVQINAPAIAFPFLRSFISTITSNAGYSPIMLPTVNFLKKNNT